MARTTFFATKNGRKQKFTEEQWSLMGKNKEGWVRNEEIQIEPNLTPAPPTGEKISTGPAKTIKVDGALDEKKGTPADDTKGEKEITVVGDEQKSEFLLALTGVNGTLIKNFFDKKEIAYDNKSKAPALKTQLAEYFNYDIAKYNAEFTA